MMYSIRASMLLIDDDFYLSVVDEHTSAGRMVVSITALALYCTSMVNHNDS